MSPQRLVDSLTPDTIERLRKLELFSRHRVEGFLKGENRSTLKGASTDFVSHRPYFPGDDIRRIDWRVFARTERVVIKEYEDLTNLNAYVAVDVSNSMAYGDGTLNKHHYAIHAAAMILYLMEIQHDSFALYLFNNRLQHVVPPGSGRRHLLRAFSALVQNPPGGETAFEPAFREIDLQVTRRGILIVFSDCMNDPEQIARVLSRFRMKGTDVIVFQITHPAEREFPFTQVSRFSCLETGRVDNIDPLEIQKAYREKFEEHTLTLKASLIRHGMDHCELLVNDPHEKALGDYLRRRMEILS